DHMVWSIGGNAINPIPYGQHAIVLLEPGEKDKELVRDINLEPARQQKGQVLGPDGQPLTGVTVQGLSSVWGHTEILRGAEFTVRGLNPRSKRQLVFHHKGKNLGFCLKELPDEKLGPLTIKLQPCGSISGRMIDQDGEPVAGVSIAQGVTTDKQGRFRVE